MDNIRKVSYIILGIKTENSERNRRNAIETRDGNELTAKFEFIKKQTCGYQ